MMGTAFLVLRAEAMERRPEGGIDEEGSVVKPPLSAQQHESRLSWGGHGRRMMEARWFCCCHRGDGSRRRGGIVLWPVLMRGGGWVRRGGFGSGEIGNLDFSLIRDPSIPAIRTLKCQKINGETVSAITNPHIVLHTLRGQYVNYIHLAQDGIMASTSPERFPRDRFRSRLIDNAVPERGFRVSRLSQPRQMTPFSLC